MTDKEAEAFPQGDFGGTGLTKREYYAAKAMQAILTGTATGNRASTPEEVAVSAVEYADALSYTLQRS